MSEVLLRLQSQLAEVQKLKTELKSLTDQIQEAQKMPAEMQELKERIEKLKAEKQRLEEEEEQLPAEFRVPARKPHTDNLRHLKDGEKLFPDPPTEFEKLNGRVKIAKPEEMICHPLPFDRPQQCGGNPGVLARVTVTLNPSKP